MGLPRRVQEGLYSRREQGFPPRVAWIAGPLRPATLGPAAGPVATIVNARAWRARQTVRHEDAIRALLDCGARFAQ